MKHVLITGGAGFIGSHLCDLLLSKGYAVTAVDNLVTGNRKNLAHAEKSPHFEFVQWDVCEKLESHRVSNIQKHGLFGVFHFACPASPVDFDRIPFEILNVDSIGTVHAVDLAIAHDARFLLASTSEIYGDPEVHPQPESYWGNVNTVGPRSCYDETKRFAEAYVSTAMRGIGKLNGKSYRPLNAAMVRIFNTYGPRMRPDDGRLPPEICMRALRGEPLTVYGDGNQTRSFCYVSDLVAGIVKLFESDLKEPVNIGNPGEFSVLEFTQLVRKLTESKSTIQNLPPRTDDPRKRCPNISRARLQLGWEPKVSLEEGLKPTLEYFRQFK